MKIRQSIVASAVVALMTQLIGPVSLQAQQRRVAQYGSLDVLPRVVHDGVTAAQDVHPSAWRPLRVAKWSTAALAAGAALYGLSENRRGDDLFTDIERVCVDQPARCIGRRPDGSYVDAALEQQYQRVRDHDRRAHAALLAGQVGVAVSAALFILDLRNAGPPRTVPYDPDDGMQLIRARDGGVGVRFRIPGA